MSVNDPNIWIGISISEKDGMELWKQMKNNDLFKESIINPSFHVFEINKRDYPQQFYNRGIRYGVIVPLYQKYEFIGAVFLGSTSAYSLTALDLICKEVRTISGLMTENIMRTESGEPLHIRLKRYEQSARALFDYNPDVMCWMDNKGTIISVNSRVEEITGYPRSHFLNQPFEQFLQSSELDTAVACFGVAKRGKPQKFEASFVHKEGQRVELDITFVPVTVDYKIVGVYGIGKDVTERNQYLAALKESNDLKKLMLESITDGFLSVDNDWRITYWNKEAERLTGIKWEDALGAVLWSALPHIVESTVFSKLQNALNEQVSVQFEIYMASSVKWYWINAYPNPKGLSIYIHDVTDRKKAEQQVMYMTYYDPLTGLPNQKLFIERLNQLLLHEKSAPCPFAVLVIDLDRFKNINELLGYVRGDLILEEVSKRLSSCMSGNDIVCRYEGNVFSILICKTSHVQIEEIANQILSEFQQPIVCENHELVITLSIGISFYPDDGMDSQGLLVKAETAMRIAKKKGKNNYQFYNEEINVLSSLNMTKELRNALQLNELSIVYQPQVNIRTGKIMGVEAMLRWKHPELGMVSPSEFIPLAEKSGLITSIGEWVLRTACAQNKAWQNQGLDPLTISVNLSPKQLTQSNLLEVVKGALNDSGLEPHFLDLEITEGMTMDVDQVLEILQQLKNLGVRISIDDFGTGYSSLYYLKRLPLNTLKIDQSFVRDCTFDDSDATIVKTIVSMAHHLGLNVIAEGVETKEQLLFLQQYLCNEVQGYLFSKPLPAEELELKLSEITSVFQQYGMDLEITEQRWIEEQLCSARQDLENTIRKQQGMTFKFREENGRFIHTLCDGELLYRMNITPQQIVGKELYDILPGGYADEIIKSYRKAWQGETDVTYENLLNGIWFLASLRPILRGGRVVEVIGNCIDITERKRAEAALVESEERYRQLIEMSPDTILVHDHGEVLFINQAGYEALPRCSSSLLESGGSFYSYLSPEQQRESEDRVKKMLNGEKVPTIVRKITRSTHEFDYYEIIEVPIVFKGKKVIQAVIRDVTERKKREEAFNELHERYKLIAENMSDLIAIFDANFAVKYLSPSHETLLGYPESYFNKISALELVHPDDVHMVTKSFAEMMSEKVPIQLEFRCIHKDKKWTYVDMKGTPIFLENGEIDQIITVSRDVTEKKKIEEKVRKSDALSTVGELAAAIAHEIRNPITSIKGFVQLMKSNQFKSEYYDVMFSEFNNLETKIDELLLLSKSQVNEYMPTHLQELIREVILLLESQAIFHHIQLMLEPVDDQPIIMGDQHQLKQLFIHLIKNAMEAMLGGGKVLIEVNKPDPDIAVVTITDEGCGISEERLGKIGEPFYSTKEKGTGLGLMISHKVVKEHGGSVLYQSKLNQGISVKVIFPIHYQK
ncbi:EAL domain-containing protein [Paenibacillus frigoriresistens]|uniref:EAL domain-containing protein n=1 Tax=Paenibacillus alginolyticus TaxID=59839 RepID=UPI001565869C|nr:EAL domain-containing protein [Paenibacillus frigoriresistens]NRF95572.1 EAL domain-containing protein [Paenibacillus frigoriresistens]